MRGIAVVASHPHKLEVVGSNPTPARDIYHLPPCGMSWVTQNFWVRKIKPATKTFI